MNSDIFILIKNEISLFLIIVLLLMIKISETNLKAESILFISNFLLLINLGIGFFLNQKGNAFNGMFQTNDLIALEKNIINLGLCIISFQAFDWLKTHRHMLEFYILLLSSVLGLSFMISSSNFLMFYLGLELSTLPIAALVNFNLEKRKSAEAAIKLLYSSAFSSAIMLFGISLFYGITGSLEFYEITSSVNGGNLQLLALIFVFAGFAFKLSAVPFHFWTADVYEGAPVSVTAFLSIISKAAMVFVFISVMMPLFNISPAAYKLIMSFAIVFTIMIGNLFAIRQNNFKRFMAYSSIVQVGYILLSLFPASAFGASASVYFLVVYLFSNLAIFGVLSIVNAQYDKEDIDDFKGFYKTNPAYAWIIAIGLFSLAGIPPVAGFFGKIFLITAGAGSGDLMLTAFAALNIIFSLYYYLRIVKVMFIDENEDPIHKLKPSQLLKVSLFICIAGILLIGMGGFIFDYINKFFTQ